MTLKKPSGAAYNPWDRARPGQAFTTPVGALPSEKPPIYTVLPDVLDWVTNVITESETLHKIQTLLKRQVSPQFIANYLVRLGHQQGYFTPDLAEVAKNNATMQVGAIGEYSKIKMNLEEGKDPSIDETDLNMLLTEKTEEGDKEMFEGVVKEYADRTSPIEPQKVEEEPKPSGLMSRSVMREEDIQQIEDEERTGVLI